jgi:hypothetical protein
VAEDVDSQELCNARSRKIVELGGFKLLLRYGLSITAKKFLTCYILFRILKDGSYQAKHLSAKALRQICVDHTVRGIFTQCGGLKLCANISCDSSAEVLPIIFLCFAFIFDRQISIRVETAHAVAKALVTTNPNLLTDHMRLGSIRALLFLCRYVAIFN